MDATTTVLVIGPSPLAHAAGQALEGARGGPFRLVLAATAADAAAMHAKGPADVVLLDVPQGAAAEEAVRAARRAAPGAPVVAWLADAAAADAALQGGADDAFARGQADRELLPRALRHALERRRLAEEQLLRTRFLTTAAHELGTPLTPIMLQLQVLRESAALPAPQAHAVEVIDRNFLRLRRLLHDLLIVAGFEAGRFNVARAPISLSDLVRLTAKGCEPRAAAGGLVFQADIEPGIVVEADARYVRAAVDNLLDNALRLTPAGGTVAVELHRAGAEARLVVRDTGPGIAAEDVPRMFQPFSHAGAPGAPMGPGTGLGLYIARGFVERHGGRVWCESPGRGRGATFGFALPMPAASAEPPAPPAKEAVGAAP